MTEIFGPGWGNYAIRGIVETSIPEPVPLYPATPGWWLLLAAVLGFAGFKIWQQWQRYRRNQYRRDAQAALDRLESAYRRGDRECLRELAPLLRATAMQAAGPRENLTQTRGAQWEAALHALAPQLPPLPIAILDSLAYKPLASIDDSVQTLFRDLRRWIADHECRDA